jgi:hypothetical protein
MAGKAQVLPIEGSLDQPPIIVRHDKSVTAVVVFLAAVGIFIWPRNPEFMKTRHVFLAGAVILFGIVSLFRTGGIELSPKGIALTGFLGRKEYAWSDFSRFVLVKERRRFFSTTSVGFYYSPSRKGFRLPSFNFYSGADGVFPGGYVLDPQELFDLINQARARWYTDS